MDSQIVVQDKTGTENISDAEFHFHGGKESQKLLR
jgi:hypothetical protein